MRMGVFVLIVVALSLACFESCWIDIDACTAQAMLACQCQAICDKLGSMHKHNWKLGSYIGIDVFLDVTRELELAKDSLIVIGIC
jgi:hypothetical protein